MTDGDQAATERLSVALAERSYDILVGPGLIETRRRGDAAAAAATASSHCHRRAGRASLPPGAAPEPRRARHREPRDRAAAGRRHQGSRPFRAADRRRPGDRHRARHDAGRARRRRGRRSHRVRRRDVAARDRFRADPDHAAGAGRQLGRRQDRDQHGGGQKPGRRLLPAAARAGRYGEPGDPAAPRGARRLWRGRQIRPDPRRPIFRMARSRGPRRLRSGTGGIDPRRDGQLPHEGRDRRG